MAGKLQRSTEFDDMYIDNDEGKYVKQSRVSSFTNKEGEMLFRASTPEEKLKYETEKRLNIKKKVDQKIGDKAKADNPYGVKNLDLNKDALLERKEKLAKEAVEKERKEKFDALKKERDKVKALEARPQVPAPPTKSATTNAPLAPAPAQNIIVAEDLTVAQATAAVEVAKKNEDIAAKEAEKKKKEAEERKKEEEKTALAAKEAQKKAEQEKVVAEKKKAEEAANKKAEVEKNALAAKKKADTDAALAIKKEQDTKARLEAAEKALVIAKQKEAADKQKEAEEAKKAAQAKAAADIKGPTPSKPASANGYTVGDYVEFKFVVNNESSGKKEIAKNIGKITDIDNINYSIINPRNVDDFDVYDKKNNYIAKIPIIAEPNKKGLKNFTSDDDNSIAKGIVKKIPLYRAKYAKGETVTYSGGQATATASVTDFAYTATILEVIPNKWQIDPPSYKISYNDGKLSDTVVGEIVLSKIATTSQINDETKLQLDNIYENPVRIKNGMLPTVSANIMISGKNVLAIENNIFILVEKDRDDKYKYYFFKKNDEVINNLTISSVTDVNEQNNTVEYVDKDFSTKTVNVSQFIALLTPENKEYYAFTQNNIEIQKSGKSSNSNIYRIGEKVLVYLPKMDTPQEGTILGFDSDGRYEVGTGNYLGKTSDGKLAYAVTDHISAKVSNKESYITKKRLSGGRKYRTRKIKKKSKKYKLSKYKLSKYKLSKYKLSKYKLRKYKLRKYKATSKRSKYNRISRATRKYKRSSFKRSKLL